MMEHTPSRVEPWETAAASQSDAGSTSQPEPLGVGATVISAVFAVLVGAVVGLITTFTHAQAVPWGLIAGLVVVVALVAGFRLVFDNRVVAAASAIGVVGAEFVLTLPNPGGTALVLSDPTGWIWAIAPAVLAAVIVVVPRPRPRPRHPARPRPAEPPHAE